MDFASQYAHSKDGRGHFQPSQIVCLEHETTRLYAEVVQIVEVRQLCWARPLVLIMGSDSERMLQAIDPKNLQDLRQGADLLLPAILFRQALDVEVIPLLSQLYRSEGDWEGHEAISPSSPQAIAARQSLNQLIRQIWQAHPDVFCDQ
ncbi:hypothetical protein ACKFKG_22750 [Phormidesmis sp. 146-35]